MRKKQSGIYCITVSRTGKSKKFYIGQSVDLQSRKTEHLRMMRAGIGKNIPMQNAFDTYGEGAFSFEILVRCIPCKELLSRMEKFFFDTFSQKYGSRALYNINRECMTSSAGVKRSPEAIENLRAAAKKRIFTEEQKERLREMGRARIGSKLSPETIAKRTESQKGVKRTEEWKQYMSSIMKGRTLSEEVRCKISETKKRNGDKPSDEHMERLRLIHVGRKMPDNVKQKLLESRLGKKKSPEEIEKRTETRRVNAALKNKAY